AAWLEPAGRRGGRDHGLSHDVDREKRASGPGHTVSPDLAGSPVPPGRRTAAVGHHRQARSETAFRGPAIAPGERTLTVAYSGQLVTNRPLGAVSFLIEHPPPQAQATPGVSSSGCSMPCR